MAKTDFITRFLIWRLRHLSTKNFVLIVSGVIGVASGFAAVILKWLVHAIQEFLTNSFYEEYANFFYIVYPIIGISLAYLIGHYVLKDKGGHGIADILLSISKKSSLIPRVKMYSRVITSALTVGFGGSVGLEAPIVMTGSSIGSNVGVLMHLNAKKRTLLIGCGAAGAISAIFGAPIGAVIFAIEVILMEVSIGSFIPLLIASVTGALTSILLQGNESMFNFSITEEFIASHVPYYFLLAVFTGFVSLYFNKTILSTESFLEKFDQPYLKLLYGGAFLGLILFIFPPIYGEGYDTLNHLVSGQPNNILSKSPFFSEIDNPYFIILFLSMILLIKPIASAITIGIGGSGGIFAPSLFVGGIAGFLFAYTANLLNFPIELPLASFTLVGMCALMSGVQHAPLSAIFLIAELTGGYELLIPLMLVSSVSYVTTTYFDKDSLYKKQLIAKGTFLPATKDEEVLELMDIRKIMETDLLPVSPEASLGDLCELVKLSRRNIFPVVNDNGDLTGIVTLDDIRELMFDTESQKTLKVKQLMHSPPEVINSNENMQNVMDKFEKSGAWNLPVTESGKYMGFISKARIFHAYRKKLIRQNQE